ncbi:hypothetical protein NC99_23390 [Sunxiuqinia dokdonensis]|uniref:Uncharacterized protein n=1 Tax=Sunxiuqinia dokdonensis TaxID=1409788 RepID=A0A0L8V9D3_9BACT|nr:hypothetical protein NC99_23390 [Sunxiuqinia dokdonensis]
MIASFPYSFVLVCSELFYLMIPFLLTGKCFKQDHFCQ